ncbi:MAG: META and DUF4377 domain-containing protein [Bryobacteraceae bacterium]|nr:META and DUF4377 domain-containing protein [Bryobacteraceae bacterium]
MTAKTASLLLAAIPLARAQSMDPSKWRLDGHSVMLTLRQERFSLEGCNIMNGSFELSGNRLKASPGISTRRACEPERMKLDAAVLGELEAGVNVAVDGDRLTTVAGSSRRTWTRVPLASGQAVTKFVYVASQRQDCIGEAPMKCLQIRESPADPWQLFYGEIVGFRHQPGIEYRLRILEERVENPPADGSSVLWYLDLIVEQKVVDPKK